MRSGTAEAERPHLDREATDERLALIGIMPRRDDEPDSPETIAKIVALEELIAGAIAEYIDLNVAEAIADGGDPTLELQEFTEEYLFG